MTFGFPSLVHYCAHNNSPLKILLVQGKLKGPPPKFFTTNLSYNLAKLYYYILIDWGVLDMIV